MTEVTVTEYETTERTVDKIECDHCSVVVDEDEATTVWMKPTEKAGNTPDEIDIDKIIDTIDYVSHTLEHGNYETVDGTHFAEPQKVAPEIQRRIQSKTDTVEEKHLCEDCVQLREAMAVRETKDYYRAFWEGSKGKIAWLAFMIPTFFLGVAQGMVFATAEAPTLVERAGDSVLVFLFMLFIGQVIISGLYQILNQ